MLRLWLLGLLAVLFVGAEANHQTFKTTEDFVTTQKKVLALLYHPSQPQIVYPELYQQGKAWKYSERPYEFKDQSIVEYYLYLRNISNLNRNDVFNVYHPEHLRELKALYNVFINARDFNSFFDFATWARIHENEGKYILALYSAVVKRPDTKSIKLPPLYELYPYLYFNSEVLKTAIDYKSSHRIVGHDMKPFVIEAKYSGWNVNHETNLLNKLNYFVEDIGLNLYYSYVCLNNPFWLKQESTIRGEEYLYLLKHLLNRYNLEKLSNGLPFVQDFLWTEPFPIGYEPNLVFHNGLPVPRRQKLAPYPPTAYRNIKDILTYSARISASIDSGSVLNSDNKWISINQPGGLNILGNLIQGNEDSINKKFYGSIDTLAKKILGYNSDTVDEHNIIPSVLETLTVPLKDPAFFSIANKIVGYYEKYKFNQKPYDIDDVIFKSLKIVSVKVDDLVTFFDSYETTINSGLLVQNITEDEEQLINVKQWRLNHVPFKYDITVDSTIQQHAFIKIFLGPKYDATNKLVHLPQGYSHFYELDSWLVTLNAGENQISRSSDEAIFTIPNYESTKQYLKHLKPNIQLLKKLAGFPQELLLPKGTADGQQFQLFVYVSPLKEEVLYQSNVFGTLQLPKQPFGFPLDKPIDELKFSQNNYKLLDVTIKHRTGTADAEISF